MHDIIIRGAKIYDGTGSDGFNGAIAIDGGIISAVGGSIHAPARNDQCRWRDCNAGLD